MESEILNKNISPDKILESKGIRPSPVRILCLRQLMEAASPISSLDMEINLDTVDRSSITRTIQLFQKKHLIHAISDGAGPVKFELCLAKGNHSPADEHIHFHCNSCGKTICLSDSPIPEIVLPEGYTLQSVNFVANGICPECSSQS